MSIDVSQYMEMLQDLPYYPYSVIGVMSLVLLLLIFLLVMRKRSSPSKRRGPSRPSKALAEALARGKPVDGLFPGGGSIVMNMPDDFSPISPRPAPTPPSPVSTPPKPSADSAVIDEAVKNCQRKFQEMYIDMYLGLGLMSDFEQLRTEVDQRLADAKEYTARSPNSGLTPEAVVLTQVASVAGNLLQSGEQHVGKGLLGIHGQELFSVYCYALTTMQEKGIASQAETQDKLDFMKHKIQELG
ncbi:MAG: hypothetical protein LBJ22_04260 [Synergistaceae bacterium]|nr:hypothetical protein [Synergistaceae bacterium]